MAKKNDFLTEVKALDIKSLALKVKDLRKELSDLVLDKNMSKLKDLKSISKKKKALAQVFTVLKQKELIEQLEKTEEKGAKK